jgi:hypothetical protein
MTDDEIQTREVNAREALRPWLTPAGALKAWLLLAALIFIFSVAPRLLTQISEPNFARWLAIEVGGALVASAAGLLIGLPTAWIGGSIILAMRRRPDN